LVPLHQLLLPQLQSESALSCLRQARSVRRVLTLVSVFEHKLSRENLRGAWCLAQGGMISSQALKMQATVRGQFALGAHYRTGIDDVIRYHSKARRTS
jgi:hypothetical protein